MSLSNEVMASLSRAEALLQAAKLLRESDLLDDSASRSYYTAFHAASALLLSQNLTFRSHAGALRSIGLNFVKTGKLDRVFGQNLNWLAEVREVGDYGEIRRVDIETADQAIVKATAFLGQVKQLLEQS